MSQKLQRADQNIGSKASLGLFSSFCITITCLRYHLGCAAISTASDFGGTGCFTWQKLQILYATLGQVGILCHLSTESMTGSQHAITSTPGERNLSCMHVAAAADCGEVPPCDPRNSLVCRSVSSIICQNGRIICEYDIEASEAACLFKAHQP